MKPRVWRAVCREEVEVRGRPACWGRGVSGVADGVKGEEGGVRLLLGGRDRGWVWDLGTCAFGETRCWKLGK